MLVRKVDAEFLPLTIEAAVGREPPEQGPDADACDQAAGLDDRGGKKRLDALPLGNKGRLPVVLEQKRELACELCRIVDEKPGDSKRRLAVDCGAVQHRFADRGFVEDVLAVTAAVIEERSAELLEQEFWRVSDQLPQLLLEGLARLPRARHEHVRKVVSVDERERVDLTFEGRV